MTALTPTLRNEPSAQVSGHPGSASWVSSAW